MICTIGCERECVYLSWEITISSIIMAILTGYIIYLKWLKSKKRRRKNKKRWIW